VGVCTLAPEERLGIVTGPLAWASWAGFGSGDGLERVWKGRRRVRRRKDAVGRRRVRYIVWGGCVFPFWLCFDVFLGKQARLRKWVLVKKTGERQ
jgi:hypothetical protein